jgi:LysR family transcriptional regulator, transcriptional activator of nhaA
MSQLNYRHLRYFWAIAHEGSLTKASERLHLSQSALSVQLAKLESQLGHALFDRVGRGLVLTEAGRIALDYADTMFHAGDELLGTLRRQPAVNRPILRVGALTTLSRNFQMEFLRPLLGRADVSLVVRSGSMRELLALLESQAVDVVLTNSAIRRDASSGLHCHLLDRQPVSLVGPPQGDAGAFRFPADIPGQPLLVPSLDSDIRLDFDRLLEQAGIRPIIRAEVDDMAMMRLLAREGKGLALVPPIVVRDELAAGVLVERCRIPDLAESFYAIVKSRRFPNPLLKPLLARGRVAPPP